MALALFGAIVLGACGGGSTGDTAEPEGGGAGTATAAAGERTDTVRIAEFNFTPPSITVSKGTTVTWTNEDDFAHTVKGDDGSFQESPSLANGQTFTHTFDEAGSFPYICGIHNSMSGTVTVT